MQLKYVLFYCMIVLILVLTIFGMIFLSNISQEKNSYEHVVSKIRQKKAYKQDENREWVYDIYYNENIKLPYINIKDNNIKKINESLLDEEYENILNASYLYSLNGELLSILYTKKYQDSKSYETFNINLNSTSVITGIDAINFVNGDFDEIDSIVSLTVSKYLKSQLLDDSQYNLYYTNTMNDYHKKIIADELDVYIGSNKDINIILDVLTDKPNKIIVNIVDKN